MEICGERRSKLTVLFLPYLVRSADVGQHIWREWSRKRVYNIYCALLEVVCVQPPLCLFRYHRWCVEQTPHLGVSVEILWILAPRLSPPRFFCHYDSNPVLNLPYLLRYTLGIPGKFLQVVPEDLHVLIPS